MYTDLDVLYGFHTEFHEDWTNSAVIKSHAMAQVVSHWPITMGARVQSHMVFVVSKVALG